MSDLGAYIFATLAAVFLVFLLAVVFVYAPRSLYVDQKCAQQGFPKSKVTVDLTGYCMNLDGSVTIKMEQVK